MTTAAKARPAVSVIMAIKDAARFLPAALASLDAQRFGDFEIVVVDGGSRDDGPRIADAHPKTRRIAQTGRGFADAWNCGIAASAGAFIAFLDSDDLWLPDKLAGQVAMFGEMPTLHYVYGKVQFFLEPGTALPPGFKPEILAQPHFAHMPGAALIRRETVEAMGPFETRWQIASDVAWFARLRDNVRSAALDAVVLRKRIHGANLSLTTPGGLLKGEIKTLMRERAAQARADESRKQAGTLKA